MQNTLSEDQVAAFYHDLFVDQQVIDFKTIALPHFKHSQVVVDVGGGCGYFASAIKETLNLRARVIDTDPLSVEAAKNNDVEALIGDALSPNPRGDEGVVCFNLILHHLVADTDTDTQYLQCKAMKSWLSEDVFIFVNEYIYESYFKYFSGWLIFQVTKSRALSSIGRVLSKIFPSLKANTFGVGVRFRSQREWRYIFDTCGLSVIEHAKGDREPVSLPRRLLFIKEIRRDSFLLRGR